MFMEYKISTNAVTLLSENIVLSTNYGEKNRYISGQRQKPVDLTY